MSLGFWMDVKKGKGFIIFVNLITRYFAVDDFGKNAAHFLAFFFLIIW